jgi:hypothetical protein
MTSKTLALEETIHQKKVAYEDMRKKLDEKPADEQLFTEIDGIFGEAGSRPAAATP